jgi:hypothetical protein
MRNFLKALQRKTFEPCESDSVLEIKKLFDRLDEYWLLYDLDNGTSFEKIFEALYMGQNIPDYGEVADLFYIGDRTLDRYVSRYNTLAWKLIGVQYPKEGLVFRLTNKYIADKDSDLRLTE